MAIVLQGGGPFYGAYPIIVLQWLCLRFTSLNVVAYFDLDPAHGRFFKDLDGEPWLPPLLLGLGQKTAEAVPRFGSIIFSSIDPIFVSLLLSC